MKNNNRVEKYFNQKNFSVAEWIFLAVAIVAALWQPSYGAVALLARR